MLIETRLPSACDLACGAIERAQSTGTATLSEADAKAILRAADITVPDGVVVQSSAEVPAELSGPFVLKAVSPTLVHKSDAGGVRVGVSRSSLDAAMREMRVKVETAGHRLDGYLVEELARAGQEVVVGAVRSEGVGWVLMLGLGGVFVEILEDVSFGITPLERAQVFDMLGELRGRALLEGARGAERVNIDALVDLICRLAAPGGLLEQLPETIAEIDLNPVIVSPGGAVAADARFVLAQDPEPASLPTRVSGGEHSFDALFRPASVAVLGASAKGVNGANLFIRNLRGNGYQGRIVPVHPSAPIIEGLPAVASLGEVDEVVDYAYVATPAATVTSALEAAEGRVRFAQVASSGFGETAEGIGLELELVSAMRRVGTRIVGPNCLGTHSRLGNLSFIPDAPVAEGGVAVVSQSGGLSVDILRLGDARGVGFHSVTSIGNGSDVSAAELVEHFLDNPEVDTIGLYLESLSVAREVLDVAARRGLSKPVVLLAGGRTSGGSRAATSHTGSLSGNHRLWPALARQAGMEIVDSLESFLDVLLALSTVDRTIAPVGSDVVLFGNGGGASVLAADALERHGLHAPLLPAPAVEALNSLGLPPGNGLHNPIDTPAGTLAIKRGGVAEDIVGIVLQHSAPALVISHLNVGIIQRNLAQSHGDVTGTIVESLALARDQAAHRCHHFLVLKGDGKPDTRDQIQGYAQRALALGIPVFGTFEDAATAAAAVLRQQHRRHAAAPAGADHQPTIDQERRGA